MIMIPAIRWTQPLRLNVMHWLIYSSMLSENFG